MRVIITYLLNAKRCIEFAHTLHNKYPVAFPRGVGCLFPYGYFHPFVGEGCVGKFLLCLLKQKRLVAVT